VFDAVSPEIQPRDAGRWNRGRGHDADPARNAGWTPALNSVRWCTSVRTRLLVRSGMRRRSAEEAVGLGMVLVAPTPQRYPGPTIDEQSPRLTLTGVAHGIERGLCQKGLV
jgi:hypothetical protein